LFFIILRLILFHRLMMIDVLLLLSQLLERNYSFFRAISTFSRWWITEGQRKLWHFLLVLTSFVIFWWIGVHCICILIPFCSISKVLLLESKLSRYVHTNHYLGAAWYRSTVFGNLIISVNVFNKGFARGRLRKWINKVKCWFSRISKCS